MVNYAEVSLVRGLAWLAEAQAAISHNLANVDTANFKRRAPQAIAAQNDFAAVLGSRLPTVRYQEHTNWQPGNSRETGHRLDVALDGQSWFRVQDAGGRVFYTRDGSLQIDKDGRLVTANGMSYLDQAGQPIQLGAGEDTPNELAIAPNGSLTDPLTGQTWGPLGVWKLADTNSLTPAGTGLFTDPSGQQAQLVADGVQQGYQEGSNVDSLQELVQMIVVQRSFAGTQRALSGVGRMQESLINNMLR